MKLGDFKAFHVAEKEEFEEKPQLLQEFTDPKAETSDDEGVVNFMLHVVPAEDKPETVGGFTDVAVSSPFADSIVWAVEKNITKGTSATSFDPDNTCTRGQIVTFLYRANSK